MHREFFQILSQKPDYVQTLRDDLNNPFLILHVENG